MAETFSANPDFQLVPSGDEDLVSADEQLDAAQTSIADDPFGQPAADSPPIPFGKSWAWDRERERYIRFGTAPAEVRGIAALKEWIRSALSTAQGVHPIFSDEFGIEDPDDWIGVADPTDAIATFESRAREALLQYDRIQDIDKMNLDYDPRTGIITVVDLIVITDQANAVPLTDIELTPNL